MFLFVPNLIGAYIFPAPSFHNSCTPGCAGYTRVILAGLSMHYMSTHPKYCTALYAVSCLLDAVDGQAARALGQTSKFGAVLDMVTDRSASRVIILCHFSLALLQVYNIMPPVLPLIGISDLRNSIPVLDYARLQQSLYAHV